MKKDILAPSVVLLDWDNTILDAWGVIHNCLMDTCRYFGKKEWNIEKTKNVIELFPTKHMENIFGDHSKEAMSYYRECFKKYKNDLFLLENARDLICTIKKHNIKMSIVSNKYGELLRDEVDRLNLTQYFHKIIGAGDAACDKPSKDVVKMALESINHDGNIWFIGDTITDMECAYNSGCLPVLYGMDKEYILDSKYPPKIWFKRHSEFIDMLESFFYE